MERARVAAGNLANAQARLQALNGQMAASTGAMATATQRFRAAQTAAAAASVSFATRLRGLIAAINPLGIAVRSEEHTSELQSLMRISYAVFCLKKKNEQLSEWSLRDNINNKRTTRKRR